jgi:mannosyltransferase OCH1-like enzyme
MTGTFWGTERFVRRKTYADINDGGKHFVLVTAHFTVLAQSESGALVHSFIQDAQLNLLFDENGKPRSKSFSGVAKKFKRLSKSGDSYVIVIRRLFRKKCYLGAGIQGGFTVSEELNSLARYRLLSVDTVLAIKRKKVRTNVISQSRAPAISRIIHQTYWTNGVPDMLKDNVERLKTLNPSWVYRFWNDEEIVCFINEVFGWDVLRLYLSINAQYGAARADLFRYLCIFYYGGVYLDIKSTVRVPLDEIIKEDDEYLLSYWNNEPGDRYAGFGLHPELHFSPRGELQQWHVIAAPRHPFLRDVIESVLDNIARYRFDVNGCGKPGVLRTTGPIAYTRAIHPHISEHNCRFISAESSGIEYKVVDDHHSYLGGRWHYSEQTAPVVMSDGSMTAHGLSWEMEKFRKRRVQTSSD